MSGIAQILQAIRKNKSLIVFLLLSIVVWTIFIFPFGDLSDLVSSKVAEVTQNQVFLQFSNMQVSLWPPGIKFRDVSVDTLLTGNVEAKELTISPSPASAFSKAPAGTISAKGIFRGDIDVSMKPAGKSESGVDRQHVEIHAAHLSLQDLRDLAQLPVTMKGQLSVDANANTDLALAEQPDADVVIKAEKFELPAQTINTQMGPVNIPDLKMSSVEFKGHMAAGKIVIDEGRLGREGDEIRGTMKGDLMLSLRNQGGLQTQMGAYNLDVDLTIKASLEDRLSLFLVALGQFKIPAGDSSRYKFHVNGLNTFTPPNLSAVK